MFAYGETVTRQRAQTSTDPYSQVAAPDWSLTPLSLSIAGCGFDPGGSTEPVEIARNAVVTQPTVYAPTGSDIAAGDRLVVRGRTWDVDGDPSTWLNPFTGWEAGMAVRLKATAG